ncbi:hypothetical protein HmCmsJML055_03727 [Escherichia coli]|nr:hypothetical protein HmCmsJML055_03727 [Escherichia coli]GCW58049.1 hypothetical protein HmCmsJML097_04479 [Escherichia coli]GDD85149.1 hypothetical protein HmCmsJML218_01824 [Escherichia coli]GDE80471.1 hypothetical protein HmCmsJML268_03126 [Escherichia coli]
MTVMPRPEKQYPHKKLLTATICTCGISLILTRNSRGISPCVSDTKIKMSQLLVSQIEVSNCSKLTFFQGAICGLFNP